jgi:hypothetical protein
MAWNEANPQGKKPVIGMLLPYQTIFTSEFVMKTFIPLHTPLPWCDKKLFMSKAPSLPLVRNTLAQQALENGCDYLLWIDSDVIPESPTDVNEALRMLYSCNAPIAACLYRAKQITGFHYAAWIKRDKVAPLPQDANPQMKIGYVPMQSWTGNWVTVDVTGMSFTLIKREVFEKTPKPWFHWDLPDERSEDFYFFDKAAQSGFPIGILTDVKFSHIGTLKVLTSGEIKMLEV